METMTMKTTSHIETFGLLLEAKVKEAQAELAELKRQLANIEANNAKTDELLRKVGR
jgi:hypothetical protein